MMNPEKGTFDLLKEEQWRKAEERDLKEKQRHPTIFVGEIVEVKGVKFQVRYIRPNGKMGLRMVQQTTPVGVIA